MLSERGELNSAGYRRFSFVGRSSSQITSSLRKSFENDLTDNMTNANLNKSHAAQKVVNT